MDSKRILKAGKKPEERLAMHSVPIRDRSLSIWSSKISAGTIDDPTPVGASLQGWALSYQLFYGFPTKLLSAFLNCLAHGRDNRLNNIWRCFPADINLWLGFYELATFPPALYWHILKCLEFSRGLATVVTKHSPSVAMQWTWGKI